MLELMSQEILGVIKVVKFNQIIPLDLFLILILKTKVKRISINILAHVNHIIITIPHSPHKLKFVQNNVLTKAVLKRILVNIVMNKAVV